MPAPTSKPGYRVNPQVGLSQSSFAQLGILGYLDPTNTSVDDAGQATPVSSNSPLPVAMAPGQVVTTQDPNNAGYDDMVPITSGTPFTAGRSFAYVCTAPGTITMTLARNGRQVSIPILASASLQTLPFVITNLVLGTAAGTFWNLP